MLTPWSRWIRWTPSRLAQPCRMSHRCLVGSPFHPILRLWLTCPRSPDPANGLFVRCGIREGSQREWLFLAPLVSSLTGPRGSAAYPRFSPLPVASVFDLSPDDLRLSIGFQKAGYCVQAAVGFAEDRHQAWKVSASFPVGVQIDGPPRQPRRAPMDQSTVKAALTLCC